MQRRFGLHRRLGRGAALQRYRNTTLSFSASNLPLGLLQHIHAVMTRACIHVSMNVPIIEMDLRTFVPQIFYHETKNQEANSDEVKESGTRIC